MKFFKLTEMLLEKVDSCPNCNGKMVQTGRMSVECPQCGFRFYTTSRYREHLMLAGLFTFVGIALAFVLGQIFEQIILKR
jgi:predicted RNA-binding Zn-ribbon protein involved in translation (DUF1610 family)